MFALGTKAWAALGSALVLVSAVVAGVAMASQEDFDPVYAPEWKPGYRYSYDVTADIAQANDGLQEYGLPVSTNLSVGPIPVKKEVLNTADYRDDEGQPVYISAATFPLSNLQSGLPILEGLGDVPAFVTAERQSDLAPIPVVPDFDCRSDSCPGGGLDFVASNPLTYLDFPLTPQKRWTQEANIPIPIPVPELQDVTRVHVVAEVTGKETIDLPGLGKTDAIRVDISYTPVGLHEVARDLARQAEQAGFQIDRFDLQLGIHEIVHYSDDYQAVVQQQYILHALVDIAVSGEFQGHEFSEDVYAEFDALIKAVLTGAELTETGQRSPLEILQKVSNAGLIGDARGKGSTTNGGYTLRLDASHTDINVADGEAVRFYAQVSGARLPDGHHLEYEVHDSSGAVVTAGDFQDGFSVTFRDAGIYRVTARAVDGSGREVASADRGIAADLKTVVPGSCHLGLLGSQCMAEAFQVQPGARSLVVEAIHHGVAPPLSESLYLHGPDDHLYSSSGRIQLDADGIADLGYGDYAASYENTGSHLGATDFAIDLDYALLDRGAPVHAPEDGGGNSSGRGVSPAVLGDMLRIVGEGLDLERGEVGVDLGRILG